MPYVLNTIIDTLFFEMFMAAPKIVQWKECENAPVQFSHLMDMLWLFQNENNSWLDYNMTVWSLTWSWMATCHCLYWLFAANIQTCQYGGQQFELVCINVRSRLSLDSVNMFHSINMFHKWKKKKKYVYMSFFLYKGI